MLLVKVIRRDACGPMPIQKMSKFIQSATGEIDVQKMSEYQKLLTIQMAELADTPEPALDERLKIEGVSGLIIESLVSAGYDTMRKFMQAVPVEIPAKVPGVNYYDLADKILEQTSKKKG